MAIFDTHENIRLLGQELIQAYENARQATTPGLKGLAREDLVRERLQSILPGGVGVGTGCVIDSYGKASDQIDIILYEQQFCPIFTVSNAINYYPCEAVIAVGEIKSGIGKKELRDIYKKVASVRKLQRSGLKNRKVIAFAQNRRSPERLSGIYETASYSDRRTTAVRMMAEAPWKR